MNSEYCTECGGVMVYRSTNNITHKSKWKCKECGHVMLNDWVPTPLEEIKSHEPRYYFWKNGAYIVKKTLNYEQIYVGSFHSEELAKKVVDGMKSVGWDKSKIPSVLKGVGL